MKLIQNNTFRYIDHTKKLQFFDHHNNALTSFAIDDALALSISEQSSPPVVRLWAHDKTVVLGIPDSRLPHLKEGVNYLANQNYHVIIRNSGGLAVALDRGVLNLSFIFPHSKKLSIHQGFNLMYQFIQYILQDLTDEIEAYEIVGSYCPGDYDLSIGGKKFAGISQRRIRNSVAIQIYLDVTGSSYDRGKIVRDFYNISKGRVKTKFIYPDVQPKVHASLSCLLNTDLTIQDVKNRTKQGLKQLNNEILQTVFSEDEQVYFQKRYQQMMKRNEKIIKWL